MKLNTTLHFAAAHFLPKYKGKCENVHGHNYKVIITVQGEVQENGLVIDFKKIKDIAEKRVIDILDHAELNKIIDNPSAENIAIWIWGQLKDKLPLYKVEIHETESYSAEYDGSKKVYIALGSNQGDREKNLWQAIALLGTKTQVNKISPIYETEPVGYKNQDDFLNMVIEANTTMSPEELLQVCQTVEKQLGRKRKILNGPRTIDLDILLYGQDIIKQKNFQVPHPRMHSRRFVLQPLVDIAPDLLHPVRKKTMRGILKKIKIKNKVKLFNRIVG